MTLYLAPCSPGEFATFQSWFPAAHRPIASRLMTFVWREVGPGEGELVAGACLYEAGPYLFVEYWASNPRAGLRDRWRAARLGLDAIRQIGAVTGLTPMVLVHYSGLARVLERAGWERDKSGVWKAPRWAWLGEIGPGSPTGPDPAYLTEHADLAGAGADRGMR